MKKNTSSILSLVMIIAVVSGCTPATTTAPISSTAVPPAAVTAASIPPTAMSATAAAPKGAAVSANGVDFVIPVSLGSGASATIVPEVVGSPDGPGWDAVPVYYKFTLQGGSFAQEATISVYPAKEYAKINEGAARSIEKLRVLIVTPSAPLIKEALPTLAVNAALDMASNMKRIAFQGGTGVRLLAHYAQAPMPLGNQAMAYHFHGLTTDEKYYIIAMLPVTVPSLQDVPFPDLNSGDNTAVGIALKNYWDKITERLTAAEKDNTLTPSIVQLDALMQSLKVNSPKIVQPAPTAAQPVTGSTANPTPASSTSCDAAFFQKDVTIPDGTVLKPNEKFTKKWEIKNIGTCSWNSSYALVFQRGDRMGSPAEVALTSGSATVAAGAVFTATIEFKAPATPGNYRSYWSIRNAAGKLLPIEFYVDIKVSQ